MTIRYFLLGSNDLIVIWTDFDRVCSGVKMKALVPSNFAFMMGVALFSNASWGFYLFY